MGRARSVSAAFGQWVCAGLPQRVLQSMEVMVMGAQGKGNGSFTLRREVVPALSLLPEEKRLRPNDIDVGANVGSWTKELLTLAPKANVACF